MVILGVFGRLRERKPQFKPFLKPGSAVTWHDFKAAGLTERDPTGGADGPYTLESLKNASKIHFLVEGIDDLAGAAALPHVHRHPHTSRELQIVRDDPTLLKKTMFYDIHDGVVVRLKASHPRVKALIESASLGKSRP